MLDDKIKVLYAIINSYIAIAETNGSRTISKHYDLGKFCYYKKWNVRFGELGYLNKPHTSADRTFG